MEYSAGDTSVTSEEHDQEDPWWQKILKQFGGPQAPTPASNENEKKEEDSDAKMETLEQTYRYLTKFHSTNFICKRYLELIDFVKTHPGNEWLLVQRECSSIQLHLKYLPANVQRLLFMMNVQCGSSRLSVSPTGQ
jgi:hypothetical protein